MTTIALLRSTYLDKYLGRAEGDLLPWTDGDCDQHLTDAISSLYPGHGIFASGDVATSSLSNEYTVPGSIARVSRIEMLDASGLYLVPVTNFRAIPGGKVVVKPLLADGYTLRFWGWKAFATTGADLPTNLEDVVAKLAAAGAYGQLAAVLTNSQRQQNLDSGRIVDHQQAVALGAYWQRIAESRLFADPSRISVAPRLASRA